MNKQQRTLVVKPLIAATRSFIRAGDGLVELYASHGLIAWQDACHTVAAALEEHYSCEMHEGQRGGYTSSNEAARQQYCRIKAVFMNTDTKGKGKSNEEDAVARAIKVCAKLSWSDWNKVVKAIEATR